MQSKVRRTSHPGLFTIVNSRTVGNGIHDQEHQGPGRPLVSSVERRSRHKFPEEVTFVARELIMLSWFHSYRQTFAHLIEQISIVMTGTKY
jgi:hypothetical protein